VLNLDLAHRRRLEISSELLGLVHADGKFRHAKCHATVEDLQERLVDESDHVAAASTDDWRHDVGLCVACHQGVDEGRP